MQFVMWEPSISESIPAVSHAFLASRMYGTLRTFPTAVFQNLCRQIGSEPRACDVLVRVQRVVLISFHASKTMMLCGWCSSFRYPIYFWAADKVISTVIPGDLGIPVLRHCHHVWPHYVSAPGGARQLYLLIHGWNVGKFAVLKHVPDYNQPKI